MPLRTDATLWSSIHRHCEAPRCLAVAVPGLCFAPPCSAIADQIDAPLTYAFAFTSLPDVALLVFAVALRFSSLPLLIRASPHHSLLRHCNSTLVSAFAVQFRALHIFAIALHIDAVRCHCFAALPESSPCHRQTILNFAFPQLCFLSPRHAFALLNEAPPYRCKSTHFSALPWPFFAPRHLALPLPCSAKPLRRILRCSASFWSSKYGPCVPVPPRPGVAASERRCRRC